MLTTNLPKPQDHQEMYNDSGYLGVSASLRIQLIFY